MGPQLTTQQTPMMVKPLMVQPQMMTQQPQIQPQVQEQQPQITGREDESTDELKSRTKRFIPGLNLLGLPKNNFKHPWYRMMVLPYVGWVGGECGLGECKYVNKNLRNP